MAMPSIVLLVPVSMVPPWLVAESAKTQHKVLAIRRVEELGGSISYDYQWSKSGTWLPDATPPGHPWLKRLYGDYYAVNPVEIQLFAGGSAAKRSRRSTPEDFTDSDARLISVLEEVRWLVLQDTGLTDVGLQHLRRISNLERLDIEGTHVTRRGVDEFKRHSLNVDVLYGER
jgi:hypothetical protein